MVDGPCRGRSAHLCTKKKVCSHTHRSSEFLPSLQRGIHSSAYHGGLGHQMGRSSTSFWHQCSWLRRGMLSRLDQQVWGAGSNHFQHGCTIFLWGVVLPLYVKSWGLNISCPLHTTCSLMALWNFPPATQGHTESEAGWSSMGWASPLGVSVWQPTDIPWGVPQNSRCLITGDCGSEITYNNTTDRSYYNVEIFKSKSHFISFYSWRTPNWPVKWKTSQ